MKKILCLFVFTCLINSCKTDDDSNDLDENILDGGIIMTSQIVEIEFDTLTNDIYQGTINGIPISLAKGNENTLVFIVTPDLPIGNILLDVDELSLKINYIIQETNFDDSVEDPILDFISNLQTNSDNIEDLEQKIKAQELVSSFINYYDSLSISDKEIASQYYYANRILLDSAIDGNYSRLSTGDLSNFTRCKAGIYLTGILGVSTTLLPASGFGAIFSIITGTATGITLAKTVNHCYNAAQSKIKAVFLRAENSIDILSRNLENNSIEINNESTKTISFSLGNRAIQSSDTNDDNQYISGIFKWLDDLNNKVIRNLNSAINSWNNIASSSFALEPYDNLNINDNSSVEMFSLTQELFDNLSFSIPEDNVEIQTLNFTSGGIELKLKIVDLDAVTTEFINTTLDVTYTNEFNNFSGSYPLVINKNSNLNLIGELNFGEVNINTSKDLILTIENLSDESIVINSIELPDAFTSDWDSGTIAAGVQQEVVISFAPDSFNLFEGTIRVHSVTEGTVSTIETSGTGVPAFTFTGDLNYGEVAINSSESRILTISNKMNRPLEVSSIQLPSGFTGDWTNGTIPVDGTREISIIFIPIAEQEYNGTVRVINNIDPNNNTIDIFGIGTPEVGEIELQGDLNFGEVQVNTSSTATLSILNNSSFPINISSLSLPQTFSSNWNGGQLAAGAFIDVLITFTPTQEQNYSGTIVVNNDVDQFNNTIEVSGNGTSINETLIIGTWRLIDKTLNGGNDFDINNCDNLTTLVYSDTQLTSIVYYDLDTDSEANDCLASESIAESYTIENGIYLYETYQGDTDISEILLLNDTTLKLKWIDGPYTGIETYSRQ